MTTEKIFTGLIIKEEDTAYWVAFPDFACCFSCGDTIEKAADNAALALQTHIDGLVKDGFRIPEPLPREAVLQQGADAALAVLAVAVTIPAAEVQNKIIPLSSCRRRGFEP